MANGNSELVELFAFWEHEKNGNVYYSGKASDTAQAALDLLGDGGRLLMWPKRDDAPDRAPSFRVVVAPDRPGYGGGNG